MDITLSKRNITFIVLTLALLSIGVGGYYAWTKGLFDQWLNPPRENVSASDEPALLAIAAMYSPNVQAGQDVWEKQVCANMTTDGGRLFARTYAPVIWSSAQAGKIPAGVVFSFVGIAEKLQDGEQIWRLSSSNAPVSTIYAMVAQDSATRKWMLVRILFDQEARVRYGS